MIVEVLTADPFTVSIRVVTPAKDAGVWYVRRQQSSKPVDVVRRRPSLFGVSVQPMDGDNAVDDQWELLKHEDLTLQQADRLLPHM